MRYRPKNLGIVLISIMILCFAPAGFAEEKLIEQAKIFFKHYVALADAFDPAVADLFSDTAVIHSKRVYPWGEIKRMTISAADWKSLIRSTMVLAKERGDRDSFYKVKYVVEKGKVRITADRYNELKKYTTPYSMLAGPDDKGRWWIYEETYETKP